MMLILRADASASMGVGHVMRCLALAQAWQDEGGEVLFAMAEGTKIMSGRLFGEGFEVATLDAKPGSAEDIRETLKLVERYRASWVVLDGYRFGTDYQHSIKGLFARVLAFDDCGQADHYCVDLVLNQNAHAHEDFYRSREPWTRLLLGLDYVQLRREFCHFEARSRSCSDTGRHLLLTFGGGDPDNVTGLILGALQELDSFEIEVAALIGATNPHRPKLEELARKSPFSVRVRSGVEDMTALYRWADLAITGGGSTLWELAYLGVPALTLILAENQEPSSRRLDEFGCIKCLGYPHQLNAVQLAAEVAQLCGDVDLRRHMSAIGQGLVDGKGASRVVRQMLADAKGGRDSCAMS